MATLTVGTGGDYATLNQAIAAATAGDVIQVIAGFSHDGNTVNVNKSGLAFTVASGVSATVAVNDTKVLNFSEGMTGVSFTGYTFNNTKTSSGSKFVAWIDESVVSFTDCQFSFAPSSGTKSMASLPGANSVFHRCRFTGTGAAEYGIGQSLASMPWTATSCLFIACGKAAIYAYGSGSAATVRNCTIYTPSSNQPTAYGLVTNQNGTVLTNSVVYSGTGGKGVDFGVKMTNDSSTVCKYVLSFGSPSYEFHFSGGSGGAATAGNMGQSDVTADGNPVFVNIGTDFRPDTDGIAFEGGLASLGLPADDLDGNDWSDPPSIGCYEGESSGGGGGPVVSSPGIGFKNPFHLDL